MGHFSIRGDLKWDEHEYIRRLRQSERLISASDLPIGDFSSRKPRRLAPKRREPRRNWETQQEADDRAADELALEVEEADGAIPLFSDDDVAFESDTDEEEEAKRVAQARWWESPQYKESRKRRRIDEAREAGHHPNSRHVQYLEEEDRVEDAQGLTGDPSAGGKRKPGRVSQASGAASTASKRGKAKKVAIDEGADVDDDFPAVKKMVIDEKDPEQWVKCAGKCGFWNVGTRGINYCCIACSKKPGTHGAACKRRAIADGKQVSEGSRSGQCEHGRDPSACERCLKQGLSPVGEEWCDDVRHFLAVPLGHKPQMVVEQPRFTMKRPNLTGYTVADSSMQRLVDSPEPKLYHVTPTRKVWAFSIPGCAILPDATDSKVSTWCVFWRLFGGYQGKVQFYVVPQKDSVMGNWGSSNRDKRAKWIWDTCTGKIVVLPTVKDILATLELTEKEVFVADWMHMTRDATRRVHKAYWGSIEADQITRGCHDELAVLIWDFNVSATHLKNEYAKHLQFWNSVTTWGVTPPAERRVLVEEINHLVYSTQPIDVMKWYAHSRKAVIRYKAADGQMQELDERGLPAAEESEDK